MALVASKITFSKILNVNVLVIGDAILDTYIYGTVDRVSPEAPVPVVHVTDKSYRLGGACNVAANIASLAGKANLVSLISKDADGDILLGLLGAKNISFHSLGNDDFKTIVKSRVICHGQQLVRLDYEAANVQANVKEITSLVMERIGTADVALLSDYGKGVLHDCGGLVTELRAAGLKVFIDPKGKNYKKYQGATVITPNIPEFIEVAGSWQSEEELFKKAHALRRKLELDAILLTRSSDGMTLFDVEGAVEKSFQIETTAKEVFDVTGAGDTVVSILALMYAAGYSMRESALLANKAAGLVVGKVGVAQVNLEELFS